jgi:hypothetical protein
MKSFIKLAKIFVAFLLKILVHQRYIHSNLIFPNKLAKLSYVEKKMCILVQFHDEKTEFFLIS